MFHAAPVTNTFEPIEAPVNCGINSRPFLVKPRANNRPVLVPSIAESAGLGRFVYLIGRSEQRYVFSSIRKGQISLYYDAVFAVVEGVDNEKVWVGDYAGMVQFLNTRPMNNRLRIFVHLLAESKQTKTHIIDDFAEALTS